MIGKIRENIKKVDVYGQSISLSFRQDDTYTTALGGFISLMIMAMIISFFYSNIISFLTMETVTSETEQIFEQDPGITVLSSDQFMFALQIEQDRFVENPFFNITVEQRYMKRLENGTQVRMPTRMIQLERCTQEHFNPIFQKYGVNFTDQFIEQNLKNFLCPRLNPAEQIIIGGSWTSPEYYFIKFSVTTCVNDTTSAFEWKPNCKTLEEVKKYKESYGSFRFQLFTTNFIINPDNAKDYIKPYLAVEQFYSFTPDTMFIQSDIFMRSKKITTDTGILMFPVEQEESFTFREHGDSRSQVEVGRLTPNYYAAFYLQKSPFRFDITRKFMTLDELLSYLGGFTQFMIAVIGIFVQFYNKSHMIIDLANDLFEFDLCSSRKSTKMVVSSLLASTVHGRKFLKQKLGQKTGDIQSIVAFTQKPIMRQSEYQDAPFKETDTKYNLNSNVNSGEMNKSRLQQGYEFVRKSTYRYLNKFRAYMAEKQKLALSLRLLITNVLPLESLVNDECVVMRRAIEQVNKELDIRYILKQLHEIAKLKQVLFTREQITLFNFSHKPTISLIKDKDHRRSTKYQSLVGDQYEQELNNLFSELLESYTKLIGLHEGQMTEEQIRFNQRLIILLGKELPSILEQEIAVVSSSEINDPELMSSK